MIGVYMHADGGDADALGLTAEERWLLHEDKPPTGWMYGSVRDHVRTACIHEESQCYDRYCTRIDCDCNLM